MTSNNVDRLSVLPEEIHSHIFSFMPTKYAVRTSILAKRWRYNWTCVTNLDFDDCHFSHDIHCLKTVIDRNPVRLTCLVYTSSIDLPFLKTLNITIVGGRSCFNPFKIICGCPILESLSLDILSSFKDEDYNLNIPTLKHFEIRTRKGGDGNKVVLNLPALESFYFWGTLTSRFVAEDLSSLISVTVFCCNNTSSTDLWVELLKAIAGAKSVSMSIPHMVSRNVLLPHFPNFKHLELKSFGRDLTWISRQQRNVDWLLFPKILQSCPELEHLCVEGGSEDSCWIEPPCVTICMLKSLQTIKFESGKSWKFNVKFLGYMLRNAEALKTVTVVCSILTFEEEKRLCAELLKVPRASRYCEVHFHGSLINFASC